MTMVPVVADFTDYPCRAHREVPEEGLWSWRGVGRGVGAGVMLFLFEKSMKSLGSLSLSSVPLGMLGVGGIYLARKEIVHAYQEYRELSGFSKTLSVTFSFIMGTGSLLLVVYFYPPAGRVIEPQHLFITAPLTVFLFLLSVMKAKDRKIDAYFARRSPMARKAVVENLTHQLITNAALQHMEAISKEKARDEKVCHQCLFKGKMS